MTKEFNKEQRNDSRPSFRKPSPGRYGEERSPRPARPRLNRETVDRAWESGAPQQHADYRPRSTNGQPSRNSNGWRSNRDNRDGQQSEYRPQNSRPGNRPYGNRPDGYRDNRDNPGRFERSSNDNQGPRARSFGPERRSFGDQRPVERQGYRSYSDGQNGTGNTGPRPYNRDNGQSRGQSQGGRRYSDQESYQRRGFERDNREPRRFERDDRDTRDTGPRRFEREDRAPRSQNGFEHGRSAYRDRGDSPRNTQNPRWQTRPANRRPEAQFEGDYEAFEEKRTRQPSERASEQSFRSRPKRHDSEQLRSEEPHVTRLPDGRVLKGPRPVQRKNAEFWTGITQNAEDLLDQIQIPAPATQEAGTTDAKASEEHPSSTADVEAEALAEGEETERPQRTGKPYKPRTRVASAATRGKKSITAPKPRGNGPKPSKRGFKWPAPQPEAPAE